MSEQWNAGELNLLRRLISFFSESAEQQLRIVNDFAELTYFDTFEGHVKTQYPLLILCMEVGYWAYRYERNGTMPNADGFAEIAALAYLMKDSSTLASDFWSVSNLTEPGLWSILRRLCASIIHVLPEGSRLSENDVRDLIAEFY